MKELLNQSNKQCGFSIENGLIEFDLFDEYIDSYGLLSNYSLFKIKPRVYKINKLNLSIKQKIVDLELFNDEEILLDLLFYRN